MSAIEIASARAQANQILAYLDGDEEESMGGIRALSEGGDNAFDRKEARALVKCFLAAIAP